MGAGLGAGVRAGVIEGERGSFRDCMPVNAQNKLILSVLNRRQYSPILIYQHIVSEMCKVGNICDDVSTLSVATAALQHPPPPTPPPAQSADDIEMPNL